MILKSVLKWEVCFRKETCVLQTVYPSLQDIVFGNGVSDDKIFNF